MPGCRRPGGPRAGVDEFQRHDAAEGRLPDDRKLPAVGAGAGQLPGRAIGKEEKLEGHGDRFAVARAKRDALLHLVVTVR